MCTPYKFLLVSFFPLSFFLFLVYLWKLEKKARERIQDTFVWLTFFCSGSTTRHRKQLSLPEQQDFFITMLNWLHPPPKKCNAILSCTEGADLMTEGNSDVQRCSGIRKHTPRAFDLPCLPLLCFHVHAFFSGGLFTSLEAIPQTICVHESTMHLVAATFFFLWSLQCCFV